MACEGISEDHCCWADGNPCQFLEENTVAGRRWACGLRRELGSWEAVHVDARYRESPIGKWFAERYPDRGCGDWPLSGIKCESCGVIGAD